jgi:hypothetical protein
MARWVGRLQCPILEFCKRLNGEPAEDAGATVELVTGPQTGMLECGSNPGLELCPDGSFFEGFEDDLAWGGGTLA